MSVEETFENILNGLENVDLIVYQQMAPYYPGWHEQVFNLTMAFGENFKVEVFLDPSAKKFYEVTITVDPDGSDEDVNLLVATSKSDILEIALSAASLRMRALIYPEQVSELVELYSSSVDNYINQYNSSIGNVGSKTIN